MIGERRGDLARDHSARGAAIEDEARGELRAEDARFLDQLQHLAGGPAIEGRRLRGDQRRVGREQGRAHQASDARRSVDDDVIDVARDLRRLAMERVARQADDAEQARQALLGALLGPVERRALRVGVDERDSLALPGPFAGEMQGQRRLADAALLVEERDDHRAPPSPVFHRRKRAVQLQKS